MIKNYFKTAWRNLRKNKVFSAINIIGLAVGMAACIVIMLFVFYEKSFDGFQPNNVYRLNEVQKFPGMVASQKVALSMFPMGPALKNEFPEIKNFTRIIWNTKAEITYRDKRIYLPQVFAVDSTFLKIFNFKLVRGDKNTALANPHSIILTEEAAKNIFGSEDPMGKTVVHYGGDTTSYAVTGIIQNVPKNSQLQFDALTTISTFYRPQMDNNWGGNWLDTYFTLAPGTSIAAMAKKFPAFLKRHMQGDGYKHYELFLLPFKDVHANASDIGLDYINYQKFDGKTTNLFAIIAGIVLLIACINFMNLSTARSAERAREVGVRKSVGAQRAQLAVQFLSETVLLSAISLLFAVIIVAITLPYVNDLSQRDLTLLLREHWGFIVAVIAGTIGVGLISGIYPALFLSSFQPVKVLKGSVETGRKKGSFRNVLVVGQFA
ncbi:MAG TPA: ABC transporter permease, partial [Mucilaginibacter sp.]|nr:ABC transporter permease [Mucilaginibacter sp.]